MNLEESKLAEKINGKNFKAFLTHIDFLASRWSSEKEYEDFREYIKNIKNNLPEGFDFVSATKNFLVKLSYKNKYNIEVKVKRNEIFTSIYKI